MPDCRAFLLLLASLMLSEAVAQSDEFPAPENSQADGEHPPSPEEMVQLIDLPPGFQATLFAGEPDVRQPISFDFDDRGRIWVAENYTYSSHAKISSSMRDRIIILHDRDGDGRHDERTVFWDRGHMLTSVVWGFGGAWILNDGTLSFIPDADQDDRPDSEPIRLVDGWTKGAGHNFVNGLTWGPDGWLYGRHGITDTSYPATVDTPQNERLPMNCGIWRFHPVHHKFEVVCNGTTNPWGLDYNTAGDLFMTNNVIGHLWHVIPGAHYERMFGADFNPRLYRLMKQTADHYHWDNTGSWTKSRNGAANDLGGGHSHCGGLIYHGQNFPPEWRGQIFMCNTHGRRVNVNRLIRNGAGYVGSRAPDFLTVNSDWFRGVELRCGPRGCLYVSDWSDYGECHDHDGVHRTSGRIYRINYEGLPAYADSAHVDEVGTAIVHGRTLATASLTELSESDNLPEWHRRRMQRLLQEAAFSPDTAKEDFDAAVKKLRQKAGSSHSPSALTAAWALYSMEEINEELATSLLQSTDPDLRRLTVRYVCGRPEIRKQLHHQMISCLKNETDPIVVMSFVSGLQAFPASTDESLVTELIHTLTSDSQQGRMVAADEGLTLMTWYALVHHRLNGYEDSGPSKTIHSFATRYRIETAAPKALGQAISDSAAFRTLPTDDRALTTEQIGHARLHLSAVLTALRGRGTVDAPRDWPRVSSAMKKSGDAEIGRLLSELGAIFGDGASLDALHAIVKDRGEDHVVREQAVRSVARAASNDSVSVLLGQLTDKAVYQTVAEVLASYDDPRIPVEILKRWNSLRHGAREAAIDTMCSRLSYARQLSIAIDKDPGKADDLTAAHVRQLLTFGDSGIGETIERHWGVINQTDEARLASIRKWKNELTPEVLAKADLKNGALLFRKSCSNCHRLYGEGGKIGPDITGSNRSNLDYLLGNILAPSAEVPRQYTTSVIVLVSGRVITGVVVSETETTVSVQTDKDLLEIAATEIEERTRSNQSLMPNGLLDPLSGDDVRDLIRFLQQRR